MTSAEFLRWVGQRPEGERYELVAGEPVTMAPQCEEPVDVDAMTAAHPKILVEALSPSTKSVDSSDKLPGYFQLPGKEHYLVVDPVRDIVIHHRRDGDGIGTSLVREGWLTLHPPGIEFDVAGFFESLKRVLAEG